jgi:hypothetical protein
MHRLALAAALLLACPSHAGAQVLTSQYDNARTDATLNETTLTPANVNAAQFGKLRTIKVDGDVYAQPLYIPRVEIPGKGVHHVVYIATEHDSVYAFDADGQPAEPLWHVSFLKDGVSPVPAQDTKCPFISPEVGITPTPVIDLPTGTLYVLARTKEKTGLLTSRYVQKLHALAVNNGVEKFGGPVEIKASVNGTGGGSVGGGDAASSLVPFDPLYELPRAGLALTSGQVYLTWASSCDVRPYHGWVMAYDARTLKQTAVFNTSPDDNESGIWQSDMAPAVDERGDVYVVTGNGTFDAADGGRDYGDSVLKLHVTGGDLSVKDIYTPGNQNMLNSRDLDFGSGGPILLPEYGGRRLMLIAGKQGWLHVLDRDRLKSGTVKVVTLGGGIYAAPAYWNGHVFVLSSNDVLKDFAFDRGALPDAPVARGEQTFQNSGAGPVVSANGTRNSIVWLIETKVWNDYNSTKVSILHAYDAANVSRELYHSEQNSARDRAGPSVRFTIPTIASGRVYIGAKGEVDVYGLLGK